MLTEIPHEELAAETDALVAEMLCVAEIPSPPVDAWAVARAWGVTIARDDGQAGRARLVRLSDRADRFAAGDAQESILIRSDPRPEREHWAVAHELGECVACELFARLGIDPRTAPLASREAMANAVAGRLLLPSTWLARDGRALDWDLLALKRRYTTASHELIGRRMLDFEPPVIVTVCDQGRIRHRWSNRPGGTPPMSPGERTCWEAAHRSAHNASQRARGLRIRGWPVHEPHWKREILRTEALGEFDDE